jgi:hypothetical protein
MKKIKIMEKVIEVNLGVGLNQLFPETTKIIIEVEDDQLEEENNSKNKNKNGKES